MVQREWVYLSGHNSSQSPSHFLQLNKIIEINAIVSQDFYSLLIKYKILLFTFGTTMGTNTMPKTVRHWQNWSSYSYFSISVYASRFVANNLTKYHRFKALSSLWGYAISKKNLFIDKLHEKLFVTYWNEILNHKFRNFSRVI